MNLNEVYLANGLPLRALEKTTNQKVIVSKN
jgi:hypothetical protein